MEHSSRKRDCQAGLEGHTSAPQPAYWHGRASCRQEETQTSASCTGPAAQVSAGSFLAGRMSLLVTRVSTIGQALGWWALALLFCPPAIPSPPVAQQPCSQGTPTESAPQCVSGDRPPARVDTVKCCEGDWSGRRDGEAALGFHMAVPQQPLRPGSGAQPQALVSPSVGDQSHPVGPRDARSPSCTPIPGAQSKVEGLDRLHVHSALALAAPAPSSKGGKWLGEVGLWSPAPQGGRAQPGAESASASLQGAGWTPSGAPLTVPDANDVITIRRPSRGRSRRSGCDLFQSAGLALIRTVNRKRRGRGQGGQLPPG